MTPTIMHVNLAKGFRGGERQTELLIKELATHGLKQYLVCRDNTPLREHLKAVSNLEFITANHQLMGHFAVHQNILLVRASRIQRQRLLQRLPIVTRRQQAAVQFGHEGGGAHT